MARQQLVTIQESNGQTKQRKLTWALRKLAEGLCFRDADGVFVFPANPQENTALGAVADQRLVAARVALGDRRAAFTPERHTGGDSLTFLNYPYASQGPSPRPYGRSLRAQYPGLARQGAGLGA